MDPVFPRLIVEELTHIREFDWGITWTVGSIEMAVRRAQEVRWGDGSSRGVETSELTHLIYGLLHGKKKADIDFVALNVVLEDAMNTFISHAW